MVCTDTEPEQRVAYAPVMEGPPLIRQGTDKGRYEGSVCKFDEIFIVFGPRFDGKLRTTAVLGRRPEIDIAFAVNTVNVKLGRGPGRQYHNTRVIELFQ